MRGFPMHTPISLTMQGWCNRAITLASCRKLSFPVLMCFSFRVLMATSV